MGQWWIVGLAMAAGLGLLLILSMAALIVVARARGVERTSIRADSLMAEKATHADYTDSYQVLVPRGRFPSLEALIQVAFQKGDLVAQNEHEILYTDLATGLRFYVSYSLEDCGEGTLVVMSTSVDYTSAKGRTYFAFVRPIHRTITPFMVSRMAG